MKNFLLALQFLTIIPISVSSELEKEDFGRSLMYFPLVGLIISLFLGLVSFVFRWTGSNFAIAAVILCASVFITGAVHLDGFCDTCDGLYGAKTRERSLEIMRDSHVGAIGVIGVAMLLVLKFAFLASISHEHLWKVLILMTVFGRWAQVVSCFSSSYVREDGKAKYFVEYANGKRLLVSTCFVIVVFLFFGKIQGVILFALAIVPVFVFISWMKKRIGGMTGDTIGAVNEIAEVFMLLFSLGLVKL